MAGQIEDANRHGRTERAVSFHNPVQVRLVHAERGGQARLTTKRFNEFRKFHMGNLPHRQPPRKDSVASASNAPVAHVCHLLRMARQPHYIKEWRKFRGLTQEQLAERIGIDKGYLSKIENGKRRYDQPFLEAAAEALKCDLADLLIRDPSDPDGIWSIWDQLRPVEREQVVEIAKTIKRTGTEG